MKGQWTNKDREALLIEQIAEKPEVEYARKHLNVSNLPPNHYLTIFGLYILDGSIMELLANNICHEPPIRHKGTFQLTPCLQALCREQQTHGLLIKGKRYDIGSSPEGYVDTVYRFHNDEVDDDIYSAFSPAATESPVKRSYDEEQINGLTMKREKGYSVDSLGIIDSLLKDLE